ncbi:hypothetical protein M758_UG305800 [Ceratodon purpureus]|nr:hypothetical protein M758_UG305800 [Ceratodon purpureus]
MRHGIHVLFSTLYSWALLPYWRSIPKPRSIFVPPCKTFCLGYNRCEQIMRVISTFKTEVIQSLHIVEPSRGTRLRKDSTKTFRGHL